MKRYALVIVAAGLWSVAPVSADGGVAPTVPVVPAPVLQNGKLLNGPGSWMGFARGSRVLTPTRLGGRDSAPSAMSEPMGSPNASATPQYHMPPLPEGVGGWDGKCGSAGCARPARGGLDLNRVKAWLCYHPSNTELPKCKPTPYITPLQGMFACTSAGCGAGCSTNCAHGGFAPPPMAEPPKPMPTPMIPPAVNASSVVMPPQGTATARNQAPSAIPGYRFATPESAAATKFVPPPAPVVNTSYKKK
jgi:hypothetical protein